MMHTQIENPFRLFWDLGYTRLVTVVPPNAELAENSVLRKRLESGDDSRGKVPGRMGRDGKWYGLKAWQNEETDPAFFDEWLRWGASCGLRTGDGLVAVDIDTLDKTAARTIYELALGVLGPAAPRIGNFPKLLLLYEITEDVPFRKIKFRTQTEDSAHVELMTAGRHFVASGTHPKTGKPYEWRGGPPARADLTRITPEDLANFFAAVAEAFDGVTELSGATVDRSTVDQNALRGDPELLHKALAALPNRHQDFPTRDDYIAMGVAIKAAFGPEHEDEALERYLQWCGRWDGGRNDETVAEADFKRINPPFAFGADYIYRKAEQLGDWTGRAEQFFTPQDMEGDLAVDNLPKAPQEGYRIMSVTDVMQMQPPKFLLDKHLPQEGFGLLYGDPGCGKSFLALDMALHIAYGLESWHGDAIQSNSRKVLYIAGEGAAGFRSRVAAWQDMHKDEIQGKEPEIGFLFQPVNFMRPDDIKKLVEAAKAMGAEWALIVVDTVSRSIPGADENLQKDMTIFVHACDALRHAMHGFVLGVHHTAKTGTMRGSSVFLGQADAVFKLTKQKGTMLARLDCEKQKDAPDGWGETYRLVTVETDAGASSLVPTRLKDGDAGAVAASTDVGMQNLILQAMDAAWKAGDPWSENARAGDRYAPRVITRDFGLRAEAAAAMVDIWKHSGLIASEISDRKSKRKGLKVVGFVTEAAADDLSGSDDTSSVFE